MKHHCHIPGCKAAVAERLLMCGAHWDLAPTKLRVPVVVNFNPDQCTGKFRPTITWIRAARAAINYVVNLNREPQAQGEK
jgi:hypothetical protein